MTLASSKSRIRKSFDRADASSIWLLVSLIAVACEITVPGGNDSGSTVAVDSSEKSVFKTTADLIKSSRCVRSPPNRAHASIRYWCRNMMIMLRNTKSDIANRDPILTRTVSVHEYVALPRQIGTGMRFG